MSPGLPKMTNAIYTCWEGRLPLLLALIGHAGFLYISDTHIYIMILFFLGDHLPSPSDASKPGVMGSRSTVVLNYSIMKSQQPAAPGCTVVRGSVAEPLLQVIQHLSRLTCSPVLYV